MHIISKILMIGSLKAGQGLDSPMEVESFNCVWHHISYCFLPVFFFFLRNLKRWAQFLNCFFVSVSLKAQSNHFNPSLGASKYGHKCHLSALVFVFSDSSCSPEIESQVWQQSRQEHGHVRCQDTVRSNGEWNIC